MLVLFQDFIKELSGFIGLTHIHVKGHNGIPDLKTFGLQCQRLIHPCQSTLPIFFRSIKGTQGRCRGDLLGHHFSHFQVRPLGCFEVAMPCVKVPQFTERHYIFLIPGNRLLDLPFCFLIVALLFVKAGKH